MKRLRPKPQKQDQHQDRNLTDYTMKTGRNQCCVWCNKHMKATGFEINSVRNWPLTDSCKTGNMDVITNTTALGGEQLNNKIAFQWKADHPRSGYTSRRPLPAPPARGSSESLKWTWRHCSSNRTAPCSHKSLQGWRNNISRFASVTAWPWPDDLHIRTRDLTILKL